MHSPPSMYQQQHSMHVDHHPSYHFSTSSSAPPPPPMSGSSHSHTHLRDSEYPPAPDSSVRSSISGYPYTNSSPQHTLPPPPVPQPQQHPSSYNSPPQQPAYVATESDATYYRTMFRELGFGEHIEGGTYPAVNGFALTMPEGGGTFGAPHTGASGGMGYHEPSHAGYTHTNPTRHHYHPYPPPPYSSSHNGYGGMVSR